MVNSTCFQSDRGIPNKILTLEHSYPLHLCGSFAMECLDLQSQLDWWQPLEIHIPPRGSSPLPWLTPCPLLWFLGLWRDRRFHVIRRTGKWLQMEIKDITGTNRISRQLHASLLHMGMVSLLVSLVKSKSIFRK